MIEHPRVGEGERNGACAKTWSCRCIRTSSPRTVPGCLYMQETWLVTRRRRRAARRSADAHLFLGRSQVRLRASTGAPHRAAVIVAAATLLLGAELCERGGGYAARPGRAPDDVRRSRAGRERQLVRRPPARTHSHGRRDLGDVVVRIVPPRTVARLCGGGGSCYSSRRGEDLLTVPAGPLDPGRAHYLLHEYAHHLELQRGRWRDWEPWMERWWSCPPSVGALLAQGKVSQDYDLGWGALDQRDLRRGLRPAAHGARGTGSAGSAHRALGIKTALRSDLRNR